MQLDQENGDTLWEDALTKEMNVVRAAFDMNDHGTKPPPVYKHVNLMMIFDVKIDFTRKARLVARGDQTMPPTSMIYSSVVSRESIRIAFLIAALNDLEISMFDISNAYLMAPVSEKLYTILGDGFGDDAGKMGIIVRAIYGLRTSGKALRKFLAATLTDLGYTSCLADPDVWMKATEREDGTKYYSYILTYVDDCFVIDDDTAYIISTI